MKKTLLSLAVCAMMAGSAEAALYLIGQPDGGEWSPMQGIPMEEVDGGWKWTGVVQEWEYFAFATQLIDTNDWDTFNANYRISPDTDINGAQAISGEYPMHLGNPEGSLHGAGTEVTYFVKEVDGAYTLTVTENSNEVLYMVGNFEDYIWSPSSGVRMTKVEDGWEWSGYMGEENYFAFATALVNPADYDEDTNLWTIFNEQYRLSPVVQDLEGDRDVVAEPGEYGLRFGTPEGAFHGIGSEVKYFVKLQDGTYTLTVTDNSGPGVVIPSDAVWGVVGEFNAWGEQPDAQMTEVSPGVWKATLTDFSGDFKFRADNAWEYNFGPSYPVSIECDRVYAIDFSIENFNIPEKVEQVTFVLDINRRTLNVYGLSNETLMLVGNFSEWSFNPAYTFEKTGDEVYELKIENFEGGSEFKISSEGWKEYYTTGVADMAAGQTYPLAPSDGMNMSFDKAYSDLTLILNIADGVLTIKDNTGGSVQIAEIDGAKVRYYNLQGSEVSNPSGGIFIRVLNGKAEKVSIR